MCNEVNILDILSDKSARIFSICGSSVSRDYSGYFVGRLTVNYLDDVSSERLTVNCLGILPVCHTMNIIDNFSYVLPSFFSARSASIAESYGIEWF